MPLSLAREHFEQQHMQLLSPILEAGKTDAVFMGRVHNYQLSFPMTFLNQDEVGILDGNVGKHGLERPPLVGMMPLAVIAPRP